MTTPDPTTLLVPSLSRTPGQTEKAIPRATENPVCPLSPLPYGGTDRIEPSAQPVPRLSQHRSQTPCRTHHNHNPGSHPTGPAGTTQTPTTHQPASSPDGPSHDPSPAPSAAHPQAHAASPRTATPTESTPVAHGRFTTRPTPDRSPQASRVGVL